MYSVHLQLPAALTIVVEELVIDMASVADCGAVVLDTGNAAGAEPFDVTDIRHLNSGLDTVLKDLEPYRAG